MLIDSGLFDARWYASIATQQFADEREAARHYLRRGLVRGVMPHPLLDPGALPPTVLEAARGGRIGVLLEHLRTSSGVHARLGPLFDSRTSPGSDADKQAHPGGALGLFLSHAAGSTPLPVPENHPTAVPDLDTARRAVTQAAFEFESQRRRALGDSLAGCDQGAAAQPPGSSTSTPPPKISEEAWVDWDLVRAELPYRDPGLVSVVVTTHQDARAAIRAVSAVLRDAAVADMQVEVVIVDNGSRRDVGLRLAAVFAAEGRVRRVRLPRRLSDAIGRNVGFALTRGSVVAMLGNDTEVRRNWLRSILPRFEDPSVRGVQALLLFPDDTILTAGTVFPRGGGLPRPFLVGHPPEDAQRLSSRPFSAASTAALAVRAEEFAALDGFDPVFVAGMEDVDYCLRAIRRYGGGYVVEPRAWVTHHESRRKDRAEHGDRDRDRDRQLFLRRWETDLPESDEDRYHDLGFDLVPSDDPDDDPTARPVLVRQPPSVSGDVPPRLRWGIKLPSTPGSWGDIWGDTYFADALARALRQQGQDVVTYRWGSHHTAASHLDDVVLGIRGLQVIDPIPGKVNMLWIISHPEQVRPEELDGFDVVFAASAPWAEAMSARSGREVLPLHQAVDTDLLPARDVPLGDGRVPVFVGGSNPPVRNRTSIHAAAAAGIGLVVHGHGWEGSPVAPLVASTNVPPARVPTVYREHGLVLADHWPDMAANGFVANRVFEAVAAGARVVSDPVVGIEELFEGAVQVYRSLDDLRALCSPAGREQWPSDDKLERIAQRCAEAHSFERRASEFLEVAVRALRTARA